MTFSLASYGFLFVLGAVAGMINVIAGGGSNLILPLLMVFGLEPQTANATIRLGVWFQNITGLSVFARKGRLPKQDLGGILLPTFCGAPVGALLAAKLDVVLAYLPFSASLSSEMMTKVILLGTMLSVAMLMLLKPSAVMHESGAQLSVQEVPKAWFWLFLAGIYGGFVQAGVGFVLLTALAGTLHYDLARANALKLLCSIVFTSLALIVFIWQGQVLWSVGFVLGAGNALGAVIGVRFAISVSQNVLRWVLFAMTVVAVLAAMF